MRAWLVQRPFGQAPGSRGGDSLGSFSSAWEVVAWPLALGVGWPDGRWVLNGLGILAELVCG